jgi:hypothetical protein
MITGAAIAVLGILLSVFTWMVKPPKQWQIGVRTLLALAVILVGVGAALFLYEARLLGQERKPPPPSLQRLVSPLFRDTCEGATKALGGATRPAMECFPPDGAERVLYVTGDSREALERVFRARRTSRGLAVGNCENFVYSFEGYEFDLLGTSGELMCYFDASRAHIEWTDVAHRVYAIASRTDQDDLGLYEWWRGSGFLSDAAGRWTDLAFQVPRRYRDDCVPDLRGPMWGLGPGIVAGLECAIDGGFELRYYAFSSVLALNSYFGELRRSGDFARSQGRTVESCGPSDVGKIICFGRGRRFIAWTNTALRTSAILAGANVTGAEMRQVWSLAGPL